MAGDEGGMRGGLPRSRAGTRSDKRARPADAAERAAEQAEKRGAAAARSALDDAEPGRPDRREHGEPAVASDPLAGTTRASDLLAGVVGAAGQVVGTGLRLATAVPRELLRRLPRP